MSMPPEVDAQHAPSIPVSPNRLSRAALMVSSGLFAATLLTACFNSSSDEPTIAAQPTQTQMVAQGKQVFSQETFGNEKFWTDAMRLPQGIAKAGVTPLAALSLGLNVNVEALSPATAAALTDALAKINAGTPATETVLANPAVTLALINEGAVIGVVPFDAQGKRKPLGSDPRFNARDSLDLGRGDKVGVSCALCHAATDNSVVPAGFAGLAGSVGKQVDGVVAEKLDVGAIFAAADNPLAYLPFLQLAYDGLGGATLGRGGEFAGIKSTDTIAQQTADARAYLTGMNAAGLRHYPLSSFDATPDGIGNATYIPPFYRTDLAAPWGSSGAFEKLEDFNNLVYTVALDPTSLLTTEGKGFLNFLAGPVGDEIATRYEKVLRDTNVIAANVATKDAIPYVQVARTGIAVGSAEGPVGRRVDQTKLLALNAYTNQLKPPKAPSNLNAAQVALGEQIFNASRDAGGANCAACHTADPTKPVENDRIRTLESLYRPYAETASLLTLLDRSAKGITNIQKTTAGPSPDYDLALVVLDASIRGEPKGNAGKKPGYAKPLLLGLNTKDEFLHNGSVEGEDAISGLENLLNPVRGANAPHAFYFPSATQTVIAGGVTGEQGRRALIEYLRSRDAQ